MYPFYRGANRLTKKTAGQDFKPHLSGSKIHVISIPSATQIPNPISIPSPSLTSEKLEKIHKEWEGVG